jgi:multimeric flavodoxin WrbA
MTVTTKELLIVAHAPSENTARLRNALVDGASHPDIDGITIHQVPPLEATVDDVLSAAGVILGTTENFGYMSGALKDFFDRIYYPCLEHTQGLPYCLCIRAGKDGTGTRIAVEKIVAGLRWRRVQEPLICQGDFQPEFVVECETFAMTMAAGLEAGIF